MTEAPILKSLAERLSPRHSALLVIDMQNDFCAEGGFVEAALGKDAAACRAVVAPIMALVEHARKARVPVVWVRADYSPGKVPPHMAIKAHERGTTAPFCHADTWGSAFFGVTPAGDEAVVDKHCYSAFIGTELDARLHAMGVRTTVLAGVQTNVCIESTLRDAASLGFNVVVASDCVASHTRELHEATLKNAMFLFGDVVPAERIVKAWESGSRVGAAA